MLKIAGSVVMWLSVLTLGMFTAVSHAAQAQSQSVNVVEQITIDEMYVEMDPEEAWLLNNKDPSDKSTFAARVKFDGASHPARIAVSGSSTRSFVKKSIRLTLQDDGQWLGGKKISLNAMSSDPSMMRVWLGWELAKAVGMPAPVTRFVRLHVNNNYAGLYLGIEWVTPHVFERDGLSGEGNLYQPNDSMYCGDLSPLSMTKTSPSTGEGCWFDFSAQKSFEPLQALVAGIDATPSGEFHQFVDRTFVKDSLEDWILVNGLIGNADSYNKNYFIYWSKADKKWSVMPWDFDLSFGRNWDPLLPSPRDNYNDNFQYYNAFSTGASSPVKTKLLENAVTLQRVRAKYRHVLGLGQPLEGVSAYGWFTPAQMNARIDALKALIEIDAKNDPYSSKRHAEFLEDVEALKYYVLARRANLANGMASEGVWLYYNDLNWVMPPLKPVQMSATANVRQDMNQLILMDKENGLVNAILGSVDVVKPAVVTTVVDGYQTPAMLPPGTSGDRCLQRSWTVAHFSPDTKMTADLLLEYHEENQRFQEKGAKVSDVHNLVLSVLEDGVWRDLPTSVNARSKTLRTERVTFGPDKPLRFVACVK
ncbi:MAG: CotH kinase family protein [Gallionella sp.]|jgi:spore coat protein CotH|nr:CotH kinase family protein [Gallionella sp.]